MFLQIFQILSELNTISKTELKQPLHLIRLKNIYVKEEDQMYLTGQMRMKKYCLKNTNKAKYNLQEKITEKR